MLFFDYFALNHNVIMTKGVAGKVRGYIGCLMPHPAGFSR